MSTSPAPWQTVRTTPHAECRVFSVLRKTCRHPVRGTEKDFFALHSADWVNVLAVTPAREIVLVRQWRFGTEEFSLELPGGMVDAGEDPLAAGVRELAEETGFRGPSARLLGRVRPNPAILDNWCSFILVEGAVHAAPLEWDPDEEIAVEVVPLEAARGLARDGRLSHGLSLNGLFLLESAGV